MTASTRWEHDDLAADLAETRRACGEIVADNLTLGPQQGARADVVAMRPSWTAPNPTIWEVKISRSDFRQDAQRGKYRAYLPFCRRFYFAAPAGLLTKAEVPAECGLAVRGENGWSVVKAPRPTTMEDEAIGVLERALLLRSVEAPWRRRDTRARRLERLREIEGWQELRYRGQEFSASVKRAMGSAGAVQEQLDAAQRRLRQALGLPTYGNDLTLAELVDALIAAEQPAVDPAILERLKRDAAAVETYGRRVLEGVDALAGSGSPAGPGRRAG